MKQNLNSPLSIQKTDFYRVFLLHGEACEILVPSPGIKPAPAALEGEVLITEPSGKSQKWIFKSETS